MRFPKHRYCFNPCFNGSSSSTQDDEDDGLEDYEVSILVLMEVPLQRGRKACRETKAGVSILVLMEVPLQLNAESGISGALSFNPCFNGSSSSTN